MKRKRPAPKDFNANKHQAVIADLSETMKELDFEKACETIAEDILLNYEGFDTIEPGPKLKGRPFDFFGFKNSKPYIIEMKGSLKSFNAPGYVQKRRMQEILKQVRGLNILLLQIKLRAGKYRVFYNDEMDILFQGRQVPLAPIVEWLNEHID